MTAHVTFIPDSDRDIKGVTGAERAAEKRRSGD